MKNENLPGNVGKMEICWIWRIAAESEFGQKTRHSKIFGNRKTKRNHDLNSNGILGFELAMGTRQKYTREVTE
jgi:hypothetical protein